MSKKETFKDDVAKQKQHYKMRRNKSDKIEFYRVSGMILAVMSVMFSNFISDRFHWRNIASHYCTGEKSLKDFDAGTAVQRGC
eukprot:snap_masked-scaffold_14-processed-gene-1.32-mRNA-1 protein AED:1.00 eAED:1.00 QI:0/-1/0/0/-1/1/1/0/82